MKLRRLLFLCAIAGMVYSQSPVYSEPGFPSEWDSITVFFDATLGDGGLAGYSGAVYAHTGVITENSTHPSDWRYVDSQWGTADPDYELESLGNDLYKLVIGYPHEYYGCPQSEEILQLAFVFRNADGSVTGRDVGGSDIFMDLYSSGISAEFITPNQSVPFGLPGRSPVFADFGDSTELMITAATVDTELEELTLLLGNNELVSTFDDTLLFTYVFESRGMHRFTAVAIDTAGMIDSSKINVMVNPEVDMGTPPGNLTPGIQYDGPTTVTLKLFAPFKDFVYVLGDFNDWMVDTTYFMKKYEPQPDSTIWWITLENVSTGIEQAFQYLVDGNIRIADPYTDLVLDGWNDPWIPESIYPNLKPYPYNKTDHPVSVFQTVQSPFNWVYSDTFQAPPQHELVIYEMLIRDFVEQHDYQTLTDTLDYLKRLGINAIELMPINEFEWNASWGYNTSFYFAPDKYYGPKNDLKTFIDTCHSMGIAVIIDMVLNHSYSQSPLVRLYWNSAQNRPAYNNPWYNETHNFQNPDAQWGNDFNHESPHTEAFVKRVNRYWTQEFKVDGFRFDFTKGFSNTIYPPNSWGSDYDQQRINNLVRIANEIWTVNPDAYVILEHLADNSEEIVLANQGMMLWGNVNYNYNEATMGWLNGSDFGWGYFGNRGWSEPNLVTYMESHDEERLNFKNQAYGNHNDSYDIRELNTSLQRMKLAGAFFFTYPGPKMLWQFGERGYDVSIDDENYGGRLGEKPPRWEYMNNPNRARLYNTWKALLKLRSDHSVFTDADTDVDMWLNSSTGRKRIKLSNESMDVVVIGNFSINSLSISPSFHHTGMWYDYFNGDSLNVVNETDGIELGPGEFRIYTDQWIEPAEPGLLNTGYDETIPHTFALHQNYPNPFNPVTTISFSIPNDGFVECTIFDIQGRHVQTLVSEPLTSGQHKTKWNGKNNLGVQMPSGMYMYQLKTGEISVMKKMVLLK